MLRILCDFCKKELEKPGGLIFSPPGTDQEVVKLHACCDCYKKIMKYATYTLPNE